MTLYPVKQNQTISIKDSYSNSLLFFNCCTCHKNNMMVPQMQPVGWERKPELRNQIVLKHDVISRVLYHLISHTRIP